MARTTTIASTTLAAGDETTDGSVEILASLAGHVLAATPLDDGLALRFAPTDSVLSEILRAIERQRRRCPFLTFRLSLAADRGPVWLELTGPPGTRRLLEAALEVGALLE